MAKLTKQEEELHAEALALVDLERDLTEDEKLFILEHFQEASTASNSTHGAFFTPAGLAQDFSIELTGHFGRIIDLCAGIGRLSFSCRNEFGHRWGDDPAREFVCVERNPEYARIGRKVMPEAHWIVGDVLDVLDMNLGRFDVAISNPPFGSIKRTKDAPGGYSGRKFEYHVIAVAAAVADYGVFIIPQMSAPFAYSGKDRFDGHGGDREYQKFSKATGITLEANCGIDTAYYREDWHGVSPVCEIVTADFEETAAAVTTLPTAQASEPTLFGEATA
ncbi:methyltransferase [Nocardia africana]